MFAKKLAQHTKLGVRVDNKSDIDKGSIDQAEASGRGKLIDNTARLCVLVGIGVFAYNYACEMTIVAEQTSAGRVQSLRSRSLDAQTVDGLGLEHVHHCHHQSEWNVNIAVLLALARIRFQLGSKN